MGVSYILLFPSYLVCAYSICVYKISHMPVFFLQTQNNRRSFYHLDPRWQILTFFNDLALEGTENLESTGGIINEDKKLQTPFLLRVFARAGVFSVWRPTSNEAIRYMMTGEGVSRFYWDVCALTNCNITSLITNP